MNKYKSMAHTLFQAFLVSIILGALFKFVKPFGIFITWGAAYLMGFAVSKTVTKNEGFLTKKRFGVILGLIVFISLCYNPIFLYISSLEIGIAASLFIFTSKLFNIFNIISITLAIWASVRHLKF